MEALQVDTLDVQRIKALIREGEVRPTCSGSPLAIALSLSQATSDCTLACLDDVCEIACRCSIVNALQGYQPLS